MEIPEEELMNCIYASESIKQRLHEAGFDISKTVTTHRDFDRDVLIVEQDED